MSGTPSTAAPSHASGWMRGAVTLVATIGACRAPAASAADDDLAVLVDAWRAAFVQGDVAAMMACYERSADTVLSHSTGVVVRGFDAIAADYEAAFAGVVFTSAVFRADGWRRSGDTAWTNGRSVLTTRERANGREWRLELGTSLVLHRSDGAWRIALEHSTPLADVPRIRPLALGGERERADSNAAGARTVRHGASR
jgi:uncharacterized protein (TIGR02246 family)